MRPHETITAFDAFLAARGLKLDAVIVGGAALALLGVISRETRDCDVMVPNLPHEILEAAHAFAANQRAQGEVLPWLQDQDANTMWPAHVEATLADLGRRLGHGV